MKIRPIILCGGAGTRLWPDQKKNLPKQFVDFGGWTLIQKTLERIKTPIFDFPIISTNLKYLKKIRYFLKKNKINKYKIVLEPKKKNTAPAVLSSALIKDIPLNQPLVYFVADNLIEKPQALNRSIVKNKANLNNQNIFIFGFKPKNPTSEYGYFLTKKIKKNINKVTKFIEKPNINKAKQIIKKNGYWNAGMFYLRKDSIINNFKKYQPNIYRNCNKAVTKAKYKSNVYYLNKQAFNKSIAKSFDYAVLEKAKEINAIKLDILWSDFGNWREISKFYKRNKTKYFKKKNVFHRPWGSYVNLFKGKNFLVKELTINPKSSISLQKHNHRSEHWMITHGKPKITLNKKYFTMKPDETIFIPLGSVHRIENPYKKPVKIIEAQVGSILKETDIVRYQDIYGRIK
jgi:mannose-1-phosphate guanylyltransferase/mannose-6-phosphate isomerase